MWGDQNTAALQQATQITRFRRGFIVIITLAFKCFLTKLYGRPAVERSERLPTLGEVLLHGVAAAGHVAAAGGAVLHPRPAHQTAAQYRALYVVPADPAHEVTAAALV